MTNQPLNTNIILGFVLGKLSTILYSSQEWTKEDIIKELKRTYESAFTSLKMREVIP